MPASDYNPNIPQPSDVPAASQNALLLNFSAIMDLIDVDHVDFAAVGAGWHNKVTLPVQATAPTFSVGNIGLYNFLDPITAVNELYLENQLGVATAISSSILSTDPAPTFGEAGWAYLVPGVLMKWGNGTATGSTVVPFPVAGTVPVFTGVMSVVITTTGAGTDTFAELTSSTSTAMTVYGSFRTVDAPTATTFQYLAIGY